MMKARSSPRQSIYNMSNKILVNRYLDAFYLGDFESARTLVAEDFKFEGPFVKTSDRESFFFSARPLSCIVRGHHLLRQWEEGNEVSSVYEVRLVTPVKSGTVVMSDWHIVGERVIDSSRVIFDSMAFRAATQPMT
jgi:ketosteroid isomerase-like protein